MLFKLVGAALPAEDEKRSSVQVSGWVRAVDVETGMILLACNATLGVPISFNKGRRSEVERVLAETGAGGDRVAADRFVPIGQAIGERGGANGPAVVACLPLANRTGRADLDSWAASLPDVIHQEPLARPGQRVVERRVVADLLQESD